MVKLTKGQEVKINSQRQLSAELNRRKEWVFPNCTEIKPFPDECKDVTSTKIKDSCRKCPYFNEVNYMVEIRKLTLEEQEQRMKDSMTEEEFNKWKESQDKKKQVRKETIVKKRKQGISKKIEEFVDLSEEEIYEKIKDEFPDRDESYLKMRIKYTIPYLKKKGAI